jgi:hypothetical protein
MRWALAASVRHTDAGAAALLPADGVASEGSAAWLRGAAAGRSDREGSSLDAVSDARGGIMSELLLDAAGRRRSPVTLPDFHAGRPPRNKGIRYPPTHRRSRKSSPSCAPPATPSMAAGCAG